MGLAAMSLAKRRYVRQYVFPAMKISHSHFYLVIDAPIPGWPVSSTFSFHFSLINFSNSIYSLRMRKFDAKFSPACQSFKLHKLIIVLAMLFSSLTVPSESSVVSESSVASESSALSESSDFVLVCEICFQPCSFPHRCLCKSNAFE